MYGLAAEEYIFYNTISFLKHRTSELSSSLASYDRTIEHHKAIIRERARRNKTLSDIMLLNESTGEIAKGGLAILGKLSDTIYLEEILNSVVSAINGHISSDSTLSGVRSATNQSIGYSLARYENALNSDRTIAGNLVTAMFHDINTVLTQINTSGGLDPTLTKALIDYVSTGATNDNIPKMIAAVEVTEHQKIFQSLYKAFSKYADGPVSPKSFQTTLDYVFQRTLGQKAAAFLLDNVFEGTIPIVDEIVFEGFHQPKSLKVSSTYTPKSGATMDLVNAGNLKISLGQIDQNGQKYSLILDSDIQVRWTKTTSKNLDIVVNEKLNISPYLPANNSIQRYVAENIIAHRNPNNPRLKKESTANFNKLRQNIAMSFFNQWAMGTGGLLGEMGAKNTDFVMINGKLYSFFQIIDLAIQQLDSRWEPFSVRIENTDGLNAWHGEKYANWNDAWLRTRRVKAQIANLTASAQFNTNFVKKLL